MTDRPPLPPFTRESAAQKVQAAEDAWNTRDPQVALAYTEDSVWRNRDAFVTGRAAIVELPHRASGQRELDYALRKDCGPSTATASRCASSTSATTPTGSGGGRTATSCGSSTSTG